MATAATRPRQYERAPPSQDRCCPTSGASQCPLAMPADHGLGLNQHKSLSPSRPEAGEPHPQEAVSPVQGDSVATDLALQHETLVAKREDLDAERERTAEEVRKRREESAKSRIHGAPRCSGPSGLLNNLGTIEFSEATGIGPSGFLNNRITIRFSGATGGELPSLAALSALRVLRTQPRAVTPGRADARSPPSSSAVRAQPITRNLNSRLGCESWRPAWRRACRLIAI